MIGILRRTCRRRTQVAVPYSPALEPGLLYMPENFEVEVGGAVVFVIRRRSIRTSLAGRDRYPRAVVDRRSVLPCE